MYNTESSVEKKLINDASTGHTHSCTYLLFDAGKARRFLVQEQNYVSVVSLVVNNVIIRCLQHHMAVVSYL